MGNSSSIPSSVPLAPSVNETQSKNVDTLNGTINLSQEKTSRALLEQANTLKKSIEESGAAENPSVSESSRSTFGEAVYQSFQNTSSLVFSCGIYYPLLRRFLEKKLITFTPGYTPEDIKNFGKAIAQKGGHFGGFTSFLASKAMIIFFSFLSEFDGSLKYAVSPLILNLSYPLYVNSNLKALKLPGYASLTNFGELKQLMCQKSSYKGITFYVISNILMFIPFFNYFSHRFETIRLAYVFGPYFGHNFTSYKEAKYFVKANNGFKHGRFLYNLFPTGINLVYVLMIMAAGVEAMKSDQEVAAKNKV